MGDEITSHNQSGGITAKHVDIGAGGSFREPDGPRLSPWKVIAGLLAAAAAVVAILTYFGLTPWGAG